MTECESEVTTTILLLMSSHQATKTCSYPVIEKIKYPKPPQWLVSSVSFGKLIATRQRDRVRFAHESEDQYGTAAGAALSDE
jgi:hypothetical protein